MSGRDEPHPNGLLRPLLPEKNPFTPFLHEQRVAILDGGLATTLESMGQDLNDPLWSARVFLADPGAVGEAHRAFLEAGADCIASVTYQATQAGLQRRGLTSDRARQFFGRAVQLALQVRDDFWAVPSHRRGRLRPLVAASVGPYGAYLADGSEYTGRCAASEEQLYEFHRDRWHLLASSGADLLACETIPSGPETNILLRLLGETPGVWAWLSFCCQEPGSLADGSSLAAAVRACADHERVAAVGANCVSPRIARELVQEVGRGTDKPILVYRNSGQRYDQAQKQWVDGDGQLDLGAAAREWVDAGASMVGGCCRIGPAEIASIRRAVL